MRYENNSPDYNLILEAEAKVLTGLHDDIPVQKKDIKNIFVLNKHEIHTGMSYFNSQSRY